MSHPGFLALLLESSSYRRLRGATAEGMMRRGNGSAHSASAERSKIFSTQPLLEERDRTSLVPSCHATSLVGLSRVRIGTTSGTQQHLSYLCMSGELPARPLWHKVIKTERHQNSNSVMPISSPSMQYRLLESQIASSRYKSSHYTFRRINSPPPLYVSGIT